MLNIERIRTFIAWTEAHPEADWVNGHLHEDDCEEEDPYIEAAPARALLRETGACRCAVGWMGHLALRRGWLTVRDLDESVIDGQIGEAYGLHQDLVEQLIDTNDFPYGDADAVWDEPAARAAVTSLLQAWIDAEGHHAA